MEFEKIMESIEQRATERRKENPEIEEELRRLEKLPGFAVGSHDSDRQALLKAELNLANLHFNPCQIGPETRFSFLKKIILRVARVFMGGQIQFNASSVRVLNELHTWVLELAEETEHLRLEQRDLLELVKLLEQRDVEPLWKNARPTPAVESVRKDLLGQSQFPNSLAFLERFRGPEEQVREQHRPYLEVFQHHEPVIDLGCGRGEFLGLMAESGIDAVGVESDSLLVEYVRRKGYQVVESDMFEYLQGTSDDSLGGVFAAQIIEHLDWRHLSSLLQLIYRKLAIGGVVVLETINPVCLSVFAEGLYLDPTHLRPYHPAGIAFLCENLGFSRTETQFSALVSGERRLQGFSEYQHYAVIARK